MGAGQLLPTGMIVPIGAAGRCHAAVPVATRPISITQERGSARNLAQLAAALVRSASDSVPSVTSGASRSGPRCGAKSPTG
jgi:hypothetical protein